MEAKKWTEQGKKTKMPVEENHVLKGQKTYILPSKITA